MSTLQAPDLLRGLRRHWLAVLLVALLGTAAGAVGSLLVPDTYVSQAQVRVLHDARFDVLEDQPADTYETVDEANRRMASAAVVALSDDVVSDAADELGTSPEQVRERMSVEPLTGADVLVFSGEADDAESAARLAQAAVDSFVTVSREAGAQQLIDGAEDLDGQADELLRDAGDPVPAAITERTDELYTRAFELRTRAAVYQGLGELVTSAQPPDASAAPGPLRGAGFGLAAGLLAGVALALLLSMRPVTRPAADVPARAPVVADPA